MEWEKRSSTSMNKEGQNGEIMCEQKIQPSGSTSLNPNVVWSLFTSQSLSTIELQTNSPPPQHIYKSGIKMFHAVLNYFLRFLLRLNSQFKKRIGFCPLACS